MEKTAFSSSLFKQITDSIETFMEQNPGPYYAAFDADGTLWDSDLGEQFFQYQIDHCQLDSLQGIDPWKYYETTKAENPVSAYLWLAQISKGQSLEQVRQWASESVEKSGARVFESQKKMISWLKEKGVEVYIVTASIQWAVEPAAKLAGVDYDHVLGIRTKIDEKGLISTEQDGWITWRDGKAKTLLKHTEGVRPLFCSGNTYGDIALIESSQCARLAIQTQIDKNSLFEEEFKLNEHAKKENWLIHHFFQ